METRVTSLMNQKLLARKQNGSFRNLQYENNLYDFSSNDYLGFSRSRILKNKISEALANHPSALAGATGSRLLSGNSAFAEQLEKEIAGYHQTANGLLFSTGYAANTALFSCLPQKGDTVIYDACIHASVIDGVRLSFAQRLKFRHNDLEDLEQKIKQSTGICYVAVESIYSMDGDFADLRSISKLCQQYGANLIVDEAHSFGVTGTGMVDTLKIQHLVFARIITFGKALGLHGAIILGADLLRDYLINFARPFIYSTAAPFIHNLSIQTAYRHLLSHPDLQDQLQHKSSLLRADLALEPIPAYHITSSVINISPATNSDCNISPLQKAGIVASPVSSSRSLPLQATYRAVKSESRIFLNSAIHIIPARGNQQAISFSQQLQQQGFDVRPIRSPSVPAGKERLRICVHLHNSDEEILELCHHIRQLVKIR